MLECSRPVPNRLIFRFPGQTKMILHNNEKQSLTAVAWVSVLVVLCFLLDDSESTDSKDFDEYILPY